MQIFVKIMGATHTLSVEENDTIATAKQKLATKLNAGPNFTKQASLYYQSKLLQDDDVLSNLAGCTLQLDFKAPPPSYDPEVREVLNVDLMELMQDTDSQLVFIALGSYDNGHGEASIKRQQCPEHIFSLCDYFGLKLTIILVDPGFSTPIEKQKPQINHIDKRWILFREKEKIHGFRCGNHRLFTYGTSVLTEEYAGSSLTLAGLDLADVVGPAIGHHGGALVVGNFYDSSHSPYLYVGPCSLQIQILQVFGHTEARVYRFMVLREKGG